MPSLSVMFVFMYLVTDIFCNIRARRAKMCVWGGHKAIWASKLFCIKTNILIPFFFCEKSTLLPLQKLLVLFEIQNNREKQRRELIYTHHDDQQREANCQEIRPSLPWGSQGPQVSLPHSMPSQVQQQESALELTLNKHFETGSAIASCSLAPSATTGGPLLYCNI